MARPVVSVASGGLAVVEAARGVSVTEAANGYGLAVTKVIGKPGLPVVYSADAVTPTAPEPIGAEFTQLGGNPSRITITVDQPLDAVSVPAASAFLAIYNFVGKVPVTVSVAGATCSLVFDADYGSPAGTTLDYTAPGTNPLRAASGGPAVGSWTGMAVAP